MARLEPSPTIAADYARRALALRETAPALWLRALTRPPEERAQALADLDRAEALVKDDDLEARHALDLARAALTRN